MRLWVLSIVFIAGCSTAQKDRGKAERLVRAGEILREQKKYMGAARLFSQAIKADPSFGRAHLALGLEYLRTNERFDEALSQFEKALDCNPELWQAKQGKVNAYKGKGNIKAAVKIQKQLVEKFPQKAEMHNNLGSLFLEHKLWHKAESCFREALRLRPGYGKALAGLGIVYEKTGRSKKAIRTLEKAVEAQPQDSSLRLRLASVLLAEKKLEAAKEQIQKVLKVEPRNGVAYHRLAEVLIAEGRMDKAKAVARRALIHGCRLSPSLQTELWKEPQSTQ